MNAQFKKGVLELLVLESVRKRDMYGYELVEDISRAIDVKEGTIYPLLKRLTNEHYFETYLRESTEGPPRKYYHLTIAGVMRLDTLRQEWFEFQRSVESFLDSEAPPSRTARIVATPADPPSPSPADSASGSTVPSISKEAGYEQS